MPTQKRKIESVPSRSTKRARSEHQKELSYYESNRGEYTDRITLYNLCLNSIFRSVNVHRYNFYDLWDLSQLLHLKTDDIEFFKNIFNSRNIVLRTRKSIIYKTRLILNGSDIYVTSKTKKDELEHSALMGKVVNSMRLFIPNFQYTMILCELNKTKYLITEYIEGNTLYYAINMLSIEQIIGYILQISFSLIMAYKTFLFTHNDLNLSNIILKPCKEDRIDYFVNNKIYSVSTDRIATMIDFEFSFAEFYSIRLIPPIPNYDIGVIQDIYRLVCYIYERRKDVSELVMFFNKYCDIGNIDSFINRERRHRYDYHFFTQPSLVEWMEFIVSVGKRYHMVSELIWP